MGLKFNPPPGWPLPWDFEPPAGWEPDPDWPDPPAGWPLWIGRDAPRVIYQVPADERYVPGYIRQSPAGQPSRAGGPRQRRRRPARRRPPRRPARTHARARRGRRRRPSRPSVASRVALVVVGLAAVAFIAVELLGIGFNDPSGATETSGRHLGQVNLLALQTGACFVDPAHTGGVASQVMPVPCTRAHNAQIYARFSAQGGQEYPGRTALLAQGRADCRSVLASRLDRARLTSTMSLIDVVPSRARWSGGQRTISCVVVDPAARLSTSLVKGHGGRGQAGQAFRRGGQHRAVARGRSRFRGHIGPAERPRLPARDMPPGGPELPRDFVDAVICRLNGKADICLSWNAPLREGT